MWTHTVLICDADIAVMDSLEAYLRGYDLRAITATSAERALQKLRYSRADIAVLDRMLPDMDGLETCRKIREHYNLPVIMLSAKGQVDDRITGLEAGANDYVTKPFSPRELILRLQRLLEFSEGTRPPRLVEYAGLTIFPESMRAAIGEHTIELTAKETQVLTYLVEHAEKVVSREQLLNAVWGDEYFGDTRVVDTLQAE